MTALVTGGSGFIGTNLVELLRSLGEPVVATDVRPPQHPEHGPHHRPLDVLDRPAIDALLTEVQPTVVYHLAARTDLDGRSVEDYRVNTDGSRNLVGALTAAGFVGRLVSVSSMLVCRNGYTPVNDTDYQPSTPYGESKVAAEEAVRTSTGLDWVICRPTSIWGPWFGPPYRDFFDAVRAGRYVHPGRSDVVKAFGFVDNVVRQLVAAVDADSGSTHYVTDPHEYTVRSFADEVAAACGRRVRTVPVGLLRTAGLAGDLAKRAGLWSAPPMTSFRLRNMQTPSHFDVAALEALVTGRFGPDRIGLADGVAATTAWLDAQDHH